jgi:uncharacterized protein YPO0396
MDTGTFKAPILRARLTELTFVLTQLDVYNWGAFGGRHVAQFDLEGTAIIGPTGSGKTTLVDALMTLITVNPRYNLASTGGQQSDRELVSYIRGVSGAGNRSGDNEHIARSGKTVTGISARFSDGEQQVTLGAVLAIDGTSSALADVKRWWIFSQSSEQGLEQWLTAHHDGGGRALKQLGRETQGLSIYDSKSAYLAQVRRFFEVGENAFSLLNRAAGLKQIDSIDEVFRELVLEDASAFDRAAEVARQFDDLTAIHAEFETARAQQESLRPVESTWNTRQQVVEDLLLHRGLLAALPVWYAGHAHRLWTGYIAEALERIGSCELRAQELAEEVRVASSHAQGLRDIYLQVGGSSVEQLRELIEAQNRFVRERGRYAEEYRRLVVRLGLDGALTLEGLLANQQHAREKRDSEAERFKALNKVGWEAGAAEQQRLAEQQALHRELQEIKARPGSNIPFPDQQFRADLAAHLALAEDELPFAAELVEVRPEEAAWRGAIERAIGGHRLRLLVPEKFMQRALAWVNDRDNRLHVRLQEARGAVADVRWFEDSYVQKLNFKRHACLDALKSLLAGLDRHCVDSPAALRTTSFGMTRQGTMSGRNGQFDKQDQKPLGQGWMTGFDNRARVDELTQSLAAAEVALRDSRARHEGAQREVEQARQLLGLFESLIQVEFATIDLPGAQRELESLEDRLTALNAPGSDTEQARARWQGADAALAVLRGRDTELARELAELETNCKYARNEQQKAFRWLGEGLTEEQRVPTSLRAPVSTFLARSIARTSGGGAHYQCTHGVRVASAFCHAQQGIATSSGSHAVGDSGA